MACGKRVLRVITRLYEQANKCKLQTHCGPPRGRVPCTALARNSQVVSQKGDLPQSPPTFPLRRTRVPPGWPWANNATLREAVRECVGVWLCLSLCVCVCVLVVNGKYIYGRNYTLKFKLYQQTETACCVHCHDSISAHQSASWPCGCLDTQPRPVWRTDSSPATGSRHRHWNWHRPCA